MLLLSDEITNICVLVLFRGWSPPVGQDEAFVFFNVSILLSVLRQWRFCQCNLRKWCGDDERTYLVCDFQHFIVVRSVFV